MGEVVWTVVMGTRLSIVDADIVGLAGVLKLEVSVASESEEIAEWV